MTEKTEAQALLEALNGELEKATSVKVTKAMRLFNQVDDIYKGIILLGARLNVASTDKLARSIREHFETMDLLGTLDSAIEDMEDELTSNAVLTGAGPETK